MSLVEDARKLHSSAQAGDIDAVRAMLADDFVLEGPVPQPVDANAFLALMKALSSGFSNFSFHAKDVHQHGDDTVHVVVELGGLHDKTFDLTPLGLPPIPPTGKSFHLPTESVTLTAKNGKFVRYHLDPTTGGGLVGILQQLGVQLPPQ